MSRKSKLTAAQQRFLQKFPQMPPDDPLVELVAWNASLEQKVDEFGESLKIWTQAILKQTELATQQNQLIVSQNMTLQSTGQTNEALGQTLMQWKQGYEQSQQELQLLSAAIAEHRHTYREQGRTLTSVDQRSQLAGDKLESLRQQMQQLEAQTSRTRQSLSGNVEDLRKIWNCKSSISMWGVILILVLEVVNFFS